MTKTRLTREIKDAAARIGFSKIGIAPAEACTLEGELLREWLARGYQASMRWMERNVPGRTDPRHILPGARSVISLALNYYTKERHAEGLAMGKISRYAWGDDYHDIMRKKLEELLKFIRQISPGAEGRIYVDTGPIMEKAWAGRAGIGWLGKHTNVITPEFGSWVFLAEILVTAELEYDIPATDHCGTCTLCIEACPTDALVAPYVLDSNRCISYLTIEHRGEIAEELGVRFDRWIYGCDICQDVCPWNHKCAVATDIAGFSPRRSTLAPHLEEILEMAQEEFSKTFSKSPVKRTKLSGLKRNAAIAAAVGSDAEPRKESL